MHDARTASQSLSGMIRIPSWGVLTKVLRGRRPCFHPGTHRENSSESAQFVICRAEIPSQSCWTIQRLSILLMHRHRRLLSAGGGALGDGICVYGPLGAAGYNG